MRRNYVYKAVIQTKKNPKEMKKRTKITLRTKIYLTIAALLTLTGVFYASNPAPFVTPGHGVSTPISVAADPTHFFTSQYFDNQIMMVDCNGNGSLFGTLPAPIPPQLTEKYMALAPAQSTGAGFTPGDLFVTLSEAVFRARPSVSGTFTLFATWAGVNGGCPFSDHSAITFDKVGTFGNKMIITCENGRVFTINGAGAVTHLADTTVPGHSTNIEGPAVLPASFGPLAGQIMVADDINNNVYTINSVGNVNYDPFGFPGVFSGAEQVVVIPEAPCVFCPDRAFLTSSAVSDTIISYPRSDFDGLGGDILVPSEASPPWGTFRVHFDVPSMSYQFTAFDATAINKEGSTFVEGICSPTPTPTPSATFTPTPTPSATFTPTPSATFTPTPSATFTPTPTPTPTPADHISQITPTGTTCNQFQNGTAATLDHLNYSVANGKVKNNVTPGVFFYWVSVTVPVGPNVVTVTQTITGGNTFTCLFSIGSTQNVFNPNCTGLSSTITQDPATGTVTVSFNAPVAGTYIISIKYDSKSIAGCTAPNPTTVHYDFATPSVPLSTQGLDLIKN